MRDLCFVGVEPGVVAGDATTCPVVGPDRTELSAEAVGCVGTAIRDVIGAAGADDAVLAAVGVNLGGQSVVVSRSHGRVSSRRIHVQA